MFNRVSLFISRAGLRVQVSCPDHQYDRFWATQSLSTDSPWSLPRFQSIGLPVDILTGLHKVMQESAALAIWLAQAVDLPVRAFSCDIGRESIDCHVSQGLFDEFVWSLLPFDRINRFDTAKGCYLLETFFSPECNGIITAFRTRVDTALAPHIYTFLFGGDTLHRDKAAALPTIKNALIPAFSGVKADQKMIA